MLINVDNHIINTEQIKYISEHKSGEERYIKIHWMGSDDDDALLLRFSNYLFAQHCGHIIDAPPGYSVVTAHLWGDDLENEYIEELPVLAFRYQGEERLLLTPITAQGEPERRAKNWALMHPDGHCSDTSGEDYKHKKAAVAAIKQRLRDELKRLKIVR